MHRLLGLVLFVLVLAAIPSQARAGGTNVAVAAAAGHVWVTTGFDVVELDARSGRIQRRIPTRYPFPLELGLSDGNVWASSVEDAFVAGAVNRIPFTSGPVTQPLVLPSRPVYSLAVGSGTTWALVGPWRSARLVAIDQATGQTTTDPLPGVGWIAADNTGETAGLFAVTSDGRAVKLGPGGHRAWTAATGRIESPLTVGLGSVWASSGTTLYRLNPNTGAVQATIPIKSLAASLTVGGGRLWVIALRESRGSVRYRLLEIDPAGNRVAGETTLGGPVGGISFGSGALWVGQNGAAVSLVRIDPNTLRAKLFANNLDSSSH